MTFQRKLNKPDKNSKSNSIQLKTKYHNSSEIYTLSLKEYLKNSTKRPWSRRQVAIITSLDNQLLDNTKNTNVIVTNLFIQREI